MYIIGDFVAAQWFKHYIGHTGIFVATVTTVLIGLMYAYSIPVIACFATLLLLNILLLSSTLYLMGRTSLIFIGAFCLPIVSLLVLNIFYAMSPAALLVTLTIIADAFLSFISILYFINEQPTLFVNYTTGPIPASLIYIPLILALSGAMPLHTAALICVSCLYIINKEMTSYTIHTIYPLIISLAFIPSILTFSGVVSLYVTITTIVLLNIYLFFDDTRTHPKSKIIRVNYHITQRLFELNILPKSNAEYDFGIFDDAFTNAQGYHPDLDPATKSKPHSADLPICPITYEPILDPVAITLPDTSPKVFSASGLKTWIAHCQASGKKVTIPIPFFSNQELTAKMFGEENSHGNQLTSSKR